MLEIGGLHNRVLVFQLFLMQLKDKINSSSDDEGKINDLLNHLEETLEQIILIGQKEAAQLNWNLLTHECRNFLVPISNGMYLLRLLDKNEPDVVHVKAIIDRNIIQLLEFIGNFGNPAR